MQWDKRYIGCLSKGFLSPSIWVLQRLIPLDKPYTVLLPHYDTTKSICCLEQGINYSWSSSDRQQIQRKQGRESKSWGWVGGKINMLCLPSKLIWNIISITKGNSLFLTVNLTVYITEHLATVERVKTFEWVHSTIGKGQSNRRKKSFFWIVNKKTYHELRRYFT